MLVVGDKEAESGTVSVRMRGEGDIGAMAVDDFLARALLEVAEKNGKERVKKAVGLLFCGLFTILYKGGVKKATEYPAAAF